LTGRAKVFTQRRDTLTSLILKFTADLDPVRTAREAREFIRPRRKDVGLGLLFAQEALRRCRKVPEASAAYRLLVRKPRALRSSAVEVLRAYEVADHILSDGLELYYSNCGENWRVAQAGLRRIGLARVATLLERGLRALLP